MYRSKRAAWSKLALRLAVVGFAGVSSVVVMVAPPTARAADAAPVADAHTPFTTVLLRNWDAWDADHDGTISQVEIDRAVKDPAVKGEDAAAAASLKLLSRSSKVTLPALTKEYFAEYEKAAAGVVGHPSAAAAEDATSGAAPAAAKEQLATRSERLPVDFDLYFAASQKRIAKGAGPAWQSKFDITHMQQGPLGDCFFIATVGSLAAHDPARLGKMVDPLADGQYRVTLPGAVPFIVPAPTDAQRAISSTTAGDGAWMAVMEQAYGRYRSVLKGGPADVEGTDVLRRGGDSSPTIAALTGHATKRIHFPRSAEQREAREGEVLPELRKELLEAMAGHRLITAGVDPPSSLSAAVAGDKKTAAPGDEAQKEVGTLPHIPPGILKKHVYAIVSYDKATDVVEIWNPHGQTFAPKGAPGLANGYVTEHGRFKLPLGEAYRFYTSFTFEQTTPAPTTSPAVAAKDAK